MITGRFTIDIDIDKAVDSKPTETIFGGADYEKKLREMFPDTENFYKDIFWELSRLKAVIDENTPNLDRLKKYIKTDKETLKDYLNDCAFYALDAAKRYHGLCDAAMHDHEITDSEIKHEWNEIIGRFQEIGEAMRRGGWVTGVGLQFGDKK